MAHFATHTSQSPRQGGILLAFIMLSDPLNNIARQNRTKREENLESIACAEGQWSVLHSSRAAFWFESSLSERSGLIEVALSLYD